MRDALCGCPGAVVMEARRVSIVITHASVPALCVRLAPSNTCLATASCCGVLEI